MSLRLEKAKAAFSKGRYKRALKYYLSVSAENFDNDILYNIAYCHYKCRQPDKAIEICNNLLEEKQRPIKIYLLLSKIYRSLSYWNDAESVIQQILLLDESEKEANLALAQIRVYQNDMVGAKEALEKSRHTIDKDNDFSHYVAGLIYDQDNKKKQACKEYWNAFQKRPTLDYFCLFYKEVVSLYLGVIALIAILMAFLIVARKIYWLYYLFSFWFIVAAIVNFRYKAFINSAIQFVMAVVSFYLAILT